MEEQRDQHYGYAQRYLRYQVERQRIDKLFEEIRRAQNWLAVLLWVALTLAVFGFTQRESMDWFYGVMGLFGAQVMNQLISIYMGWMYRMHLARAYNAYREGE